MAAKHPSKIPKNLKVYIDTNIFHLYLRGPQGPRKACTHLLEKVEKGEAQGYTSTLVLDELLYKLLLKKIEEPYGENPPQNPKKTEMRCKPQQATPAKA